MPDSAQNVSAAGADNTTIESLETEGYLLANKRSDATVKRSVRLSIVRDDDASKIGETKTNTPRDIDSIIGIPKTAISIIARDSLSEERAMNDFIGDVTNAEEECHFVTGSSYKGSWDALGMSGVGRYVMPHGTAYEGEIRDGMFHGRGSLYWPKNGRLDVVHHRGKLREYRYTFEDGLVYDYEDWSYCKFPDRRFYESVKKGLRPGGRTLKTGKQPTKVLPFGCYDAGDGVFDPKTWRITSYDDTKKVLRVPKKEEYDWIIKNCRKSWSEPTGYRLSLNENWSDNPPDLPYNIAMSDDSPDSWWKRLTTFKRQFDPTGEEDSEDMSIGTQDKDLPTPEVCLCGQYVLLGEPCCCGEVPPVADDKAEEHEVSLQSVVHSSIYSSEKSTSQEKCKRIPTIEQGDSQVIQSSRRAPEDPEVGVDRLFNVSKGSAKYYFSDESLGVEKDLENRREDATEALEIIVERTKSTDAVEKETLQKWSVDHTIQHGSRVDVTKNPMSMKISMGNDKDEKAKQKHVTEQEDLQKVVMESGEEVHARRRYTVDVGYRREQEEYAPILAEERSQRAEEKESIIAANEKREENTDQRSILDNYDYATVSIPREKVASVTEPETGNGRRMMSERSKLLPKGTTTERDLPFDRSGEVAIRSDVIDTHVIRETLQESTVSHSVSNETPNNIAANVSTSAMKPKKKFVNDADDDKLPLDQSEESTEDTQSPREFYRSSDVPKKKSRDFDKRKPMKYPEISKVSVGVSDNAITNEGKLSEIQQDDFSLRNVDEGMRKMETISGSSNRVVSRITAKEDFRLRDSEEQSPTEGNSVSLKNDLPILEELHRSLATFSPEKQKSTEGKEIIEIYKKYASKKTAVAKPMDMNVWRLSGSAENNGGPQLYTKDILFPPTLTTQRCELIEGMRRKPCGVDVCKPAMPEVRTSGSLCRKEFPFNIPAKSSRSSAGNIRRKK